MNESNVVVKFLNKMTDLIVLNVLFLLCCIPVVTIGASLSAMFSVNMRSIRYGDGYIAKRFFAAFKQCFKQSTIVWVIMLLIGGILFVDYRFWSAVTDQNLGGIMKVVSLVLAVFLLMIAQWVFPVIAKMEDKLSRQIKNSLLIAIGCFVPYTVIVFGMSMVFGYFVYSNLVVMIFALLVGFAFVNWLQSFFIYKAFSKFITEEPVGDDDPLYSHTGESDTEGEGNFSDNNYINNREKSVAQIRSEGNAADKDNKP